MSANCFEDNDEMAKAHPIAWRMQIPQSHPIAGQRRLPVYKFLMCRPAARRRPVDTLFITTWRPGPTDMNWPLLGCPVGQDIMKSSSSIVNRHGNGKPNQLR
jgi:hypothetical protein